MSAKRNGRTSMIRSLALGSPRRSSGRAFRDSAPGWRRSCVDGALNPFWRTKRTSKPFRLRRLRNDRKGPWSVFFHRASFPLRGAPPGKSRRRRRFRRVFVRRKSCRARPPAARAFAFSSSRAPCAGGSRDPARRMQFPPPGLSSSGRARRLGFYRGRPRKDFARSRVDFSRILDKGPFPCVWPSGACGVRVRKRVFAPGPCGASSLPPLGGWNPCGRRLAGRTSSRRLQGSLTGTASFPRRGAPPTAAGRCRGP